MERTRLTEADEGKQVVNASGDDVGIVTEITGGKIYIDSAQDITEAITSKLGWSNADDEYVLENDSIARVTDEEVHLKD